MDELTLAQNKINQLTRRVEELEELIRTARDHALTQQITLDNLEQFNSNQNFCDRCEELITERLCVTCYLELFTPEEEDEEYDEVAEDERNASHYEIVDSVTRPNSPFSKIIQA